MDIVEIIEIFALVTGVPYIVLEVMQKNAMWYFGIASGLACAVSFAIQSLWASMGLNVYYVVMSIWGLYQWKKDSGKLSDETGDIDATVHLTKLTWKTVVWSVVIFVVGTLCLITLLYILDDAESRADAVITVMSAVGMYWLAKAYPQHWFIWIVADLLLTGLCASTGMYWMAALYLLYVASSLFGFFHWRKNGRYVA